jgi:hypothetical protein
MDDLYAFTKYNDNQDEKKNSKWEIIYFFEKYYLIDEKRIDAIIKTIGMPKTINRHGERLYNIFFSKDTGPADTADFLIDLAQVFIVNISNKSTIKISSFRDKSHTLQEWVTFFKERFPKILDDDENYPKVFKQIFTLAYRKLNKLGGMNELLIKLENLLII